MNVRVFTLKFSALLGGFDDSEVRTFIADKEVHAIHDHAFVYQGFPHLTLVVLYHAHESENSVPTRKNHANEREDNWRKSLTETDMPLFNTLREWRASKGREEDVPTYFVCTNKQLADIANTRPDSMTALAKVDGFGEGRLKKYGQEILAILDKKVGMNLSHTPEQPEKTVPTLKEPNGET